MMARKFNLPVVPLHIRARNSALFYLFDRSTRRCATSRCSTRY